MYKTTICIVHTCKRYANICNETVKKDFAKRKQMSTTTKIILTYTVNATATTITDIPR